MPRKVLTDRGLKALKPAPDGKSFDVMDGIVPGFGVRVLASGRRSFILVGRYPGSRNPTRRALGAYGALELEKAREKARCWLALLEKGVDPQTQEQRERQAKERLRKNTFEAVAEDFIKKKLRSERKGDEVERDIRREFIPSWGSRPITELTRRDIRDAIEAKMDTAPAQARN